jgi:hypothetical protein
VRKREIVYERERESRVREREKVEREREKVERERGRK